MGLHVDPAAICLLIAVAFAAGWLDAVVGGGGLVQVPALMLALPSVPVATVLGTNKLVAITGTSGAAVTYVTRVGLDRRRALVAAALGLPTALVGAVTASHLPRDVIVLVVAATLVAVGVWAVVARPGDRAHPDPRPDPRPQPCAGTAVPAWRPTLVLAVGASTVGFYSGVVGSGTGVLLVALFVTALGTDFLRGSAMAKVVSIGSDLGALALFGLLGHVLWLLGAGMAVANVAGGIVGARTALARGAGFVRAVLLIVVVGLVVKIVHDQWLAR
ncbi:MULTISPECIES: sulfite exporter TauE/SafE family protein [unclassified Isoptericola]|uniref:sulfite exporter TauE/SafE family protein n=1 Tax=unclassified Isoptericola TaxID=2623355 RepID=UPI00365E6F9B